MLIPPQPLTKSSIKIMDYSALLMLSLPFAFLFFMFLHFTSYGNGKIRKLPPGPKPLPVFGNIFKLTDEPHRALARLSTTYGPLMFLKLGSVDTMVVSSSEMAREVFVNHDLALSNRHVPQAAHALDHNNFSVAWLPVSPQWRNLRKISAIHLFTKKRLDLSESLRLKKASELLEYTKRCCRNGQAVDIGQVAFTTSLNLMSNTFFSADMASYGSASSQEFKEIICKITEFIGKPNPADFFPFLRCLDPLKIRRNTAACFVKLFAIFDDLISQRLSSDPSSVCGDKGDVLERLLEISQEDGSGLSLDDIKHLLLDMFIAGTDTNSSALEWAMAELLRSPSKMAKAQVELDEALDKGRMVQESYISKLPYLQAIVKETLRLHPPAPLLVPRKAREDVQFCNHTVPRDTQVVVNAWAIGRDPNTWENPFEFSPERFLKHDVDMNGQDFELIPFGAGRRICPGMPLAFRMMHLMLASLLHNFDWKLANGMCIEDVDMSEKFGIVVHMAKELLVVPIPR